MVIENIKIYKTLKDRLGDQETEGLLQYIDEKVTTGVATKDDIHQLGGEITKLDGKIDKLDGKIELVRTELGGSITNLKTDLEGKINNLKTDLEGKINNLKTELEGKISNLKTDLEGKIDKLDGRIGRLEEKLEKEVATKVDLAKLEGRFQLYFVVLAVLVILTNPKVLDLFGKLIGLSK